SATEWRWCGESTSHRGDSQERLALFAERRHAEQVGAACFVIEQNSLEDGLHISTHPRTIVVEGLHYAIEVSCTRLAGDKPLNELATNEWPDVLVIENIVEGQFQVLRAIVIEIGGG